MSVFDEVIAAATARLAMDGELRLEVRRELRGHLEDSAAEYQTAGYAAERAAEEAVKHLGDPGELAEELWRANRRRLRVRAVAKWAARTVLIPLAVLVAFLPSPWSVRESWRQARTWLGYPSDQPAWVVSGGDSGLDALTQEQWFVWFGDPSAKSELEAAKSIVDRWPGDAVYQGYYTSLLLARFVDNKHDERFRGRVLAALERGNEVEPGNGMYDVVRAAMLFERSCELDDESQDSYEIAGAGDKKDKRSIPRITVTDEAAFERGLAAFRAGVGKPVLNDHMKDIIVRRLNMLPPPRRYQDYLHRTSQTIGMILPTLGWERRSSRAVVSYAVALARRGEVVRARELLGDVERLGIRQAAGDEVIISMLVGHSLVEVATGGQWIVGEISGDSAEVARARESLDQMTEVRHRVMTDVPPPDPRELRMRSLIGAIVEVPGAVQRGVDPDREAERIKAQLVVLEFGLWVGLIGLMCLWTGQVGSWLWAIRRGDASLMLFVGWRRIVRAMGWGLVVPEGAYVLYMLSPLSGREFGVAYAADRMLVELLVVLLAVGMVLTRQIAGSVRERAVEVGMVPPTPLPGRKWHRWVTGILAALVGIYLVVWQIDALRPQWPVFGHRELPSASGVMVKSVMQPEPLRVASVAMIGLIVMVMLGWVFVVLGRYRRAHRADRVYAATLVRSALPMLAAALIVLGWTGKWMLAQTEAASLAQVRQAEDLPIFQEIERSNFKLMREFYRQWQAEGHMPAEEGVKTPSGGVGG